MRQLSMGEYTAIGHTLKTLEESLVLAGGSRIDITNMSVWDLVCIMAPNGIRFTFDQNTRAH